MGYNLRSLLSECKKSTGNNNVELVWGALQVVIGDTLRTGKGVSIRNLLKITSIRSSIRDPGPRVKVRSELVFCANFARTKARSRRLL